MPKKITSPTSRPPRWARMPAERRMVSPGSGTPVLSAITPKRTIRYPYRETRWRMLSTGTTRRGSTRPPASHGRRATARIRPPAYEPQEGGEVAGQHISRVVHPEVESGEADQEHDEYPRDGHGPAGLSAQPGGQDEREHPVESHGDGGVAARKRIEGGLVARVEEFGTRPLEYALQDGG